MFNTRKVEYALAGEYRKRKRGGKKARWMKASLADSENLHNAPTSSADYRKLRVQVIDEYKPLEFVPGTPPEDSLSPARSSPVMGTPPASEEAESPLISTPTRPQETGSMKKAAGSHVATNDVVIREMHFIPEEALY